MFHSWFNGCGWRSSSERKIYNHQTFLEDEIGRVFKEVIFYKEDLSTPLLTLTSSTMMVHPHDKIVLFSSSKTDEPLIISFQSKYPFDKEFKVDCETSHQIPGHLSSTVFNSEEHPYQQKIFRIQVVGPTKLPEDLVIKIFIVKMTLK
jgi:xylose isomerase